MHSNNYEKYPTLKWFDSDRYLNIIIRTTSYTIIRFIKMCRQKMKKENNKTKVRNKSTFKDYKFNSILARARAEHFQV